MKQFSRTMVAKTAMFLLFTASALVLAVSVTGAAYFISENLYDTDYAAYMNRFYRQDVFYYPWEHILLDQEGWTEDGMSATLTDNKGRVVVSSGNPEEYWENYMACGMLASQTSMGSGGSHTTTEATTIQEASEEASENGTVYQAEGMGNILIGSVYGRDTDAMNRLCMGVAPEQRYLKYVFPVKAVQKNGILTDMYLRSFATFDEEYNYQLTVFLGPAFFTQRGFVQTEMFLKPAFDMKYRVYPIGLASAVVLVLTFTALMTVAGRRPGSEAVHPGVAIRIPYDVLLAILGMAGVCQIALLDDLPGGIVTVMGLIVSAIIWVEIILGLCMTTAVRLKMHNLLNGTLTWRLAKWGWKVCKSILQKPGNVLRGSLELVSQIPIIWKTALALGVLTMVEFVVLMLCWYEPDILTFLWALEKLILIPAVLWLVLGLKRLQTASNRLAEGDLSYQVDTKGMVRGIRHHGESLNRISAGMAKAVEEQLKSERMKTELITNVSHDIKTPLTSIINYTGLIEKEADRLSSISAGAEGSEENGLDTLQSEASREDAVQHIREYADVLTRQSNKLKRLLEDLVEASKASTGNLEVLPERCDAGMFVSQMAGEYDEKLSAAELTLITVVPEQSIIIMADSRRMWRIFDNLMQNVCKYSQPGTRVYVSLEQTDKEAVIIFRNTSREALNISADELIERFVRGDSSRNTEGNGLGLSIARSLTELQGGNFSLDVDGDLFKVTLRFPALKN